MSGTSYLQYYGRLARRSTFAVAKGLALPLVRRQAVRSGAHEMAFPVSTYAPWHADHDFGAIYERVRRSTLVDVWRCHELWALLGEIAEVPGDIIEVGVWRGGTGALLAARARQLGLDAEVFLCDTWEGVVKTSEVDTYYRDGKHDDTSRARVERLLAELHLDGVGLLEGVFPDATAQQLEGRSFRLCHIDVDVYQSAKDVLEWAWPRLSPQGVVVFDDYGCAACPGVTKLVNDQRNQPDRLVVHNLNGHALVIKR